MAFPRLNLLCSGARENTRENSKVQNCQVLRPYNSYPPASKLTYNTSLESPNIFLYEKLKKVDLKAFLSYFMNTQSNLVSYHKTTIVPDSLRLAVSGATNQTKNDMSRMPDARPRCTYTVWYSYLVI